MTGRVTGSVRITASLTFALCFFGLAPQRVGARTQNRCLVKDTSGAGPAWRGR